jgi:hypothetical protein
MVDGELGFRGTTSIMASGAKTEVRPVLRERLPRSGLPVVGVVPQR